MEPLRPDDPRQIGDYRLAARLGAGGMGLVYLGRSPAGRPVAVKVVHAHFAHEPGFRARFRREVDAARAVSGAYTAPVIDADPDAPTPWLVTAFLPGLSLHEAVAVHGPFTMPAAYALGAGLAEGLQSVHHAGVVHRDLKPSNVLLSQDGPRIIDFGIARAAETGDITRAGKVIGSPGYMSPEQATGRDIGPASDVFSLGAVLTYAVTGGGPFGTGAAQVMIYRVVHTPPALDQVPDPYLRALIAACLHKDPAQRPTPTQVLARLAPHATTPHGTGWLPDRIASAIGHIDTLPPAGTGAPPHGLSRRRLLIAGGAGGAIAAAGGIAAAVAAAGGPSGDRPTPVPSVSARPAAPSAAPPAGQVVRRYTAAARVTFGPVLMAGTVYLSEGFSAADLPDGRLVAIDLKSGERRWRFDPRGTSSRVRVALPHVAAAGQVYVARYGALYALDAAGGGLRWSYRPETAGPQTKPVVLGDTVYCLVRTPSARAGSVNGLRLVALDAATGSVRWSGSTEETKAGPDDRVDLAAAGGLISVIDGDLYVFDAVGRRLQRRHRLNGAGAAAVAGGTVFAVDEDGLRAIRAGKVQWAFTASRWITGAPFALHGDTVYLSTGVGDTSALHAIDAATGKTRWRFAADDTRAGALTASGGVVYVTQSTSLYALDAATGQVRWRYRGEAQIGDDLVAANGTVYVQEGARTILALRAPRPAAAPTG